jgi:gamma-glutamyltranspeptidase/glutathione hydrolase
MGFTPSMQCLRSHSSIARGSRLATSCGAVCVVLIVLVISGCKKPPTSNPPSDSKTSTAATNASERIAEDEGVCVVASVHPLATRAGLAAYRRGGNAVDAAIATALTLGVVDTSNSGIGGGCFILIRRSDGALVAIDGRETAPAAATRDMFVRDGEADSQLSQTGPLAVATPGALAAYQLALEVHGELSLANLLLPAAQIAEEGFPIDRVYARKLKAVEEDVARFAGSRAVLLNRDRAAWPRGHVLKQPDLAKTYRAIANEGVDWFYRGPFAEKVGQWMADNGGVLTAADFAAYLPLEREPLVTTFREWTIVGFPPPSSGGVHVAEILNILEHFDLAAQYKREPAKALHIIAEAMKLAFADRAYWLGDPDFVDVPRGLLDENYAAELANRIDVARATDVPGHGEPPRAAEDLFGKKHTTHIAAADSEGNWVAITATINTAFGSKVIIPGTGVVLNNEMDDFSAQPGKPNAFGLVGAEHNSIAPGKRPLSSMSPTIVMRNDEPVMTVGAAGGPKIITQALLAIVRRLEFNQSLADAVGSPRIHHQWIPKALMVEDDMPEEIITKLREMGHAIEDIPPAQAGATQAVERNADGILTGVHDPRVPGKAGSISRPHEAVVH